MKEGEFTAEKVQGLSHDCSPTGHVWVCLTKTRAGNDGFYKWLVKESILPFVDQMRSVTGMDNAPVFYSFDGEEIQIRNFLDQSFLPEYTQRLMLMVKHSASFSAKSNALDAGNLHKASKKVSKSATKRTIMHGMAPHQTKLDDLFFRIRPLKTKATRDQLVDAVLRTVVSLQTVFTHKLILHSFEKTGQLIDPTSSQKNFFDSKMALYPGKRKKKVFDALRAAFPGVVEKVKSNGKCTEIEMDQLGVPRFETNDRRTKDKDQRPMHNQRACCMNHDSIVKEYAAYHAAKRNAPLLREAEQERTKAQREEKIKLERERIETNKRDRATKKRERDEQKEATKKRKMEEKEAKEEGKKKKPKRGNIVT